MRRKQFDDQRIFDDWSSRCWWLAAEELHLMVVISLWKHWRNLSVEDEKHRVACWGKCLSSGDLLKIRHRMETNEENWRRFIDTSNIWSLSWFRPEWKRFSLIMEGIIWNEPVDEQIDKTFQSNHQRICSLLSISLFKDFLRKDWHESLKIESLLSATFQRKVPFRGELRFFFATKTKVWSRRIPHCFSGNSLSSRFSSSLNLSWSCSKSSLNSLFLLMSKATGRKEKIIREIFPSVPSWGNVRYSSIKRSMKRNSFIGDDSFRQEEEEEEEEEEELGRSNVQREEEDDDEVHRNENECWLIEWVLKGEKRFASDSSRKISNAFGTTRKSFSGQGPFQFKDF